MRSMQWRFGARLAYPSRHSTIALAFFASLILGNTPAGTVRAEGAELSATQRVLRPGDHGVGRRVTVPAWRDIEGREGRFSPPSKGLVVAMTSSTCPLSRKVG